MAQTITIVAGNATPGPGYYGDGGPATLAGLDCPDDIAFDSLGNYYIGDACSNTVREVSIATSIISTYAGVYSPSGGYVDGPATVAQFYFPSGLAFDAQDNLYIADFYNNVIRKVDRATTVVSTFAGTYNTPGFSGDGGPASLALFTNPNICRVGPDGNLYVSDDSNDNVRMINLTTNIITTVVGDAALPSGYSGDGGPATLAQLNGPEGMAFDAAGNFYVTDSGNSSIRRVDAVTKDISTVVGSGPSSILYSGDGGPATLAHLNLDIGSVTFACGGNLLLTDDINNRVRMVNASTGIINTVIGTGLAGISPPTGGLLTTDLNHPESLAFDKSGNLYLVDYGYSLVQVITGFCTTPTNTFTYTPTNTATNTATATATFTETNSPTITPTWTPTPTPTSCPAGVTIGTADAALTPTVVPFPIDQYVANAYMVVPCGASLYQFWFWAAATTPGQVEVDIYQETNRVFQGFASVTATAGSWFNVPLSLVPVSCGGNVILALHSLSPNLSVGYGSPGSCRSTSSSYASGFLPTTFPQPALLTIPSTGPCYEMYVVTCGSGTTPTPSFTFTQTPSPTNSPTSTATPTATNTPTNTATVTCSFTPTNSPTMTWTPTPTWGISLGKQVSKTRAQSGDTLTYTLGVTLAGFSPTGVVVTDTLPANVSYLSEGTPSSGTATFLAASSQFLWTLPSPLSPGVYSFSYQTQVNPLVPAGVSIINDAQLTYPGIPSTLTASTTVLVAGDITVKVGVYNEAGELIKTLLMEKVSTSVMAINLVGNTITSLNGPNNQILVYSAGALLAIWDGRDSSGNPVTNGVYHIKVDNMDSLGVVTTVTQQATVSRSLAQVTMNIYNEAGEVVKILYNFVDDSDDSRMMGVSLSTHVIAPGAVSVAGAVTMVQITLQTTGPSVTFSWDGTSDNGSIVSPGQYMVEAHWNNAQGTTDITQLIMVTGGTQGTGKVTAQPNVLSGGTTRTTFVLDSSQPMSLKVNVYTVAGELVKSLLGDPGSNQALWDTGSTASGLYLAVVEISNPGGGITGRQILKIVIVH